MTTSQDSGEQSAKQMGHMQDQAIQWLLKQTDGTMSAADWEAFTLWLEEDHRHAAAFDTLVASDEELVSLTESHSIGHAEAKEAANDNPLSHIAPWAMAAAAALVLAIFVFPIGGGSPQFTTVTTVPGELQTIAMNDEISVTLNGSSEIAIAEGEPTIIIERGEVAFAIDAAEPTNLRVKAEELVLTDFGTVFNVSLDPDTLTVSVAEGIVIVNPDAEGIQIDAGEAIEKQLGSAKLTIQTIGTDTVGSWREGRLEFDNTPLDKARLQIHRRTGLNIEFDPEFSRARLTGSIIVPQDAEAEDEFVSTVAGIIGGSANRTENGWTIK